MSGLRSEWTPQQVQENLSEASENLPEARTTDRFPVAGTASGMDLQAGEDLSDETEAVAGSASEPRLPQDPPRRATDQAGQ